MALALNAIQHLLLIAGIVGVARAGVAGKGRAALVGIALSLGGLVVLTAAELVAMTDTDTAGVFYGLATLAMAGGLITLGVAVVRTGAWHGWQRYSVLATGLYIPLVLGPAMALPWYWPNFAVGIWGFCWLLVGIALTSDRS